MITAGVVTAHLPLQSVPGSVAPAHRAQPVLDRLPGGTETLRLSGDSELQVFIIYLLLSPLLAVESFIRLAWMELVRVLLGFDLESSLAEEMLSTRI